MSSEIDLEVAAVDLEVCDASEALAMCARVLAGDKGAWLGERTGSDAIDHILGTEMKLFELIQQSGCESFKKCDDYKNTLGRFAELKRQHCELAKNEGGDAASSSGSFDRNGTLARLEPYIAAATRLDPVARGAYKQIANEIRLIENVHGVHDIIDLSEIHTSQESAFRASARRASLFIHKVGTTYYVSNSVRKKGYEDDGTPGYEGYSRKQLFDMFENRQLFYVKVTKHRKDDCVYNTYDVKRVQFIELYLKQQVYFSEKLSVTCTPPEFLSDDADSSSVLNMWQPMAAASMQFPETKAEARMALLLFLDHMDRMMGKEEDSFEFGNKWFGNLCQFPHLPGRTMLVLVGLQGVGKSLLAELIARIIGKHLAVKSSNPAVNVLGNFNGMIQGKSLIHLEEVSEEVLRAEYNRLKDMVGGETLTIERKHTNASEESNTAHLFITTNAPAPVDADRRSGSFAAVDEFCINPNHPTNCSCEMCKRSHPFFASLGDLFAKPTTHRIVYEYLKTGVPPQRVVNSKDIPMTLAREVARCNHMDTQALYMIDVVARFKKGDRIAPRTKKEERALRRLVFTSEELWADYDAWQNKQFQKGTSEILTEKKAIGAFKGIALQSKQQIEMSRPGKLEHGKRPWVFTFKIDAIDVGLNGIQTPDSSASLSSTEVHTEGEHLSAEQAGASIVVADYVVRATDEFIAKLEARGAWPSAHSSDADGGDGSDRSRKRPREGVDA